MFRKQLTESFPELYRKYYCDVHRFLSSILKNSNDVDDLVQDTFIKVNKNVDWEKVRNPKSYLFQAAHNLTIDQMRKHKRAQHFEHDSDIEIGTEATNPERVNLSQEQITLLTAGISSLSPSVQQVFVLNKLYNLSYKDVAAITNLSIKTVEKHIAKGMVECLKMTSQVEVRKEGVGQSKVTNINERFSRKGG